MNSKPKILLLHPPASKKRRYQLDGYCSQPQKGPFRWHPLDFCAFASKLSREADLEILDLGISSCHDFNARPLAYDFIIGLIGAYGWDDQLLFWKEILKKGVPVFLSGDIARYEPQFVFEHLPNLGGIIPELSLPPALSDLSDTNSSFIWRPGRKEYSLPSLKEPFSIGIQNFNLWKHSLYHLPFNTGHPFASIITQVGCPYHCDYCILSTYPSAKRDLNEVEEELESLKKQGAKHVYIRDATLNSSQKHLEAVCDLMKKTGLPWNAFVHTRGIGKFSKILKESGCIVLQLGIDSPDQETLRRKNKIPANAEEEIHLLQKEKISTAGHFIYRLEDNPLPPQSIARYADEIGLNWFTLTPFMIRPGMTSWDRKELSVISTMDSSIERLILKTSLWFYSRPSRVFRLIRIFFRHPIFSFLSLMNLLMKDKYLK
ncbi:MAG: radical SAM protein [Candidatus Aureabacteria bacterium]|nr:radical SAM protein [Candidatus Auribacterota bacterium]